MLQSNHLLASVVEDRYPNPDDDPGAADSITLFDYYEIGAGTPEQRLERGIGALRADIGAGVDGAGIVTLEVEMLDPEMALEVARLLTDTLSRHLAGGVYTTLQVTAEEFTLASDYLARFETALRTLDALHLACTAIGKATLVTADETLAQSAEHLGVGWELLSNPGVAQFSRPGIGNRE